MVVGKTLRGFSGRLGEAGPGFIGQRLKLNSLPLPSPPHPVLLPLFSSLQGGRGVGRKRGREEVGREGERTQLVPVLVCISNILP